MPAPFAASLLADQNERSLATYFVANYPPFSLWQPDHVPELLGRLRAPGRDGAPLGAYLHIPFCRKRCHFCYFRVYTDKNAAAVREYLDAVVLEAGRLGAMPFARRPLRFLYFGGGTPSYLSIPQLDRLMDGPRQALDLSELEEFAFECEPGTLTPGKLERIRELGVTRLSLGVEHFDDFVLEAGGRAHRSGEIGNAFARARQIGFPQINIDLIAGMLGDDDERWHHAVQETIRLAPDAVTIYQMEVPKNTTIARRIREDGEESLPLPDWKTKRRWTAEAFAALEAAGYVRSSAYTTTREPARGGFVYRDALWRGADMLAIGVSSFGHASGCHYQNEAGIAPYLERVGRGELAVARALPTPDEARVIRQFVLQLKLGRVSRERFLDEFGTDILDRFDGELRLLEESGYLQITEAGPVLTGHGLLRVDRVLPMFFLPEHQRIAYV